MIERARQWARRIRRDIVALYVAGRDPRTPWLAKALAIAITAYALSPIDLIPDFIPVLGSLDDLIIVPLGMMLAIRLIPPGLMVEFRNEAAARERLPKNWLGAALIVGIWIVGSLALALWLFEHFL